MGAQIKNPVYQTQAWKKVRAACLARDGFRCQLRLPGCRGRASSADHILKLEWGGAPYDLANLQAACVSCNTAKENRLRRGRRRGVRRW